VAGRSPSSCTRRVEGTGTRAAHSPAFQLTTTLGSSGSMGKERFGARHSSIEITVETAAEIASAMRTGNLSASLKKTLTDMRAAPEEFRHRTVAVRHRRQSASVDEKIAPLVLETWRASIPTMHSCEDAGPRGLGHEDKAGLMQVGFPTTVGAKRWLAIVCESGGVVASCPRTWWMRTMHGSSRWDRHIGRRGAAST
jgi:hypothetical protein